MIKRAISQGIDINEPDELGNTALMFAAYNGHSHIVYALIDKIA